MRYLLFDRNEDLVGALSNTTIGIHSEAINGENILEITTFDTKEIEKNYRVVYKDEYGYWHEFIVRGIEEEKTESGLKKELFCESSFYETIGDYINDRRIEGSADSALLAALEPTRWEVGRVDDLGINHTNFYRISAKEAVQKIVEVWGGEIQTRISIQGNKITNRYVDILFRRGADHGKRFTYTKDLESVIKTIQREDVITALYGYGKGEEVGDGYGRRINFSDINNGKAYVENDDAKKIWGRNDINHGKTHVFGKVEYDDVEDKEELLKLTRERLEELSNPLITYEAKVIDLKAFGFEHEGVALGDDVLVIDKEYKPELRIKARIVKIIRNHLEPEQTTLVLGNFIADLTDGLMKQEKYINEFRGKEGVWDRSGTINSDGTINANYLNGVLEEVNSQINSDGGYVYITEDGEGLLTYDKPIEQNPTKAIQLKGGSLRIANEKNPNGEWDYRTAATGDGLVADVINTGVLNANLIKAGVLSDVQGNTVLDLQNGLMEFAHINGGYTRVGRNGFERLESGEVRPYQYRTYVGSTDVSGELFVDGITVNLPNDFNGKDFVVVVALRGWRGGIIEEVQYRPSFVRVNNPIINKAQGRFTVSGSVGGSAFKDRVYWLSTDILGSNRKLETIETLDVPNSVDGVFARGTTVYLTYTAIY